MSAAEHGTGSTYRARVNTYFSFWKTPTGKVTVAVDWDKRADKVHIGQQEFNRGAGDVFVIIRQPDGRVVSTQLPSAGPDADPKTALEFIQKHMTNDSLVASIRLPKRD